jgi:hypothetical protein
LRSVFNVQMERGLLSVNSSILYALSSLISHLLLSSSLAPNDRPRLGAHRRVRHRHSRAPAGAGPGWVAPGLLTERGVEVWRWRCGGVHDEGVARWSLPGAGADAARRRAALCRYVAHPTFTSRLTGMLAKYLIVCRLSCGFSTHSNSDSNPNSNFDSNSDKLNGSTEDGGRAKA